MSLSRTTLARYIAKQITKSHPGENLVESVAAAVATEGHDPALLMRDVRYYLESDYGLCSPVITSARPLSDKVKENIENFIAEDGLSVSNPTYKTDKDLVGGAIIETAGKTYDMSVISSLSSINTKQSIGA